MLSIIFISILLVFITTLIHGFILSPIVENLQNSRLHKAITLPVGVQFIVFIHVMEAALYGVGFYFGASVGLGSFKQTDYMSMMDYQYFSLVNYNTLGLGDIYPTGHLRFLAGVEALNGFLLISCSAMYMHKLMTSKP
jgi:potassium channel LctB